MRDSADLTRTKRGAGAADASAEDVAKLLIAGMATDSPARASERVRHFWHLPMQPHPSFPAFAALEGCRLETFGVAVTDLIARAPEIAAMLIKRAGRKKPFPVDVDQLRGSFEAALTIDRSGGSAKLQLGEARGSSMWTAGVTWALTPSPRPTLDWTNSATVSIAAILDLSLTMSEVGS